MKDKQRKPKTQYGFDFMELAELITKPIQHDKERMDLDEPIKPKQNEDIYTRTNKEHS